MLEYGDTRTHLNGLENMNLTKEGENCEPLKLLQETLNIEPSDCQDEHDLNLKDLLFWYGN